MLRRMRRNILGFAPSMSLAAILSATAPSVDRPGTSRAQLVFAAQTLVEYQARQAIQAGAEQIFVLVDAVTPFLSRMVDRFAESGAQLYLIRDMTGLIRQLPRESDVLLFADGAVIDPRYVAQLARAEGNALLVAPDDSTTAHLERLDAQHRWAGLARVSPATLFNTLDLIGDWDVVLTLVRAVTQSAPHRVAIAASDISEGRVALVDRQEMADPVGKSLVAAPVGSNAGAELYLLQWPARIIATKLLRMQVSAMHIALAALGVAAAGLLAIIPQWTILSLVLLLGALGIDRVARQLAAMGQHDALGGPAIWALPLLVSLGLFWQGAAHGAVSNGLHLGLVAFVSAVLADRQRDVALPPWGWMTPGSALCLLLLGTIAGQFGGALALAALLGVASLAAMLLMGGRRSAV